MDPKTGSTSSARGFCFGSCSSALIQASTSLFEHWREVCGSKEAAEVDFKENYFISGQKKILFLDSGTSQIKKYGKEFQVKNILSAVRDCDEKFKLVLSKGSQMMGESGMKYFDTQVEEDFKIDAPIKKFSIKTAKSTASALRSKKKGKAAKSERKIQR